MTAADTTITTVTTGTAIIHQAGVFTSALFSVKYHNNKLQSKF